MVHNSLCLEIHKTRTRFQWQLRDRGTFRLQWSSNLQVERLFHHTWIRRNIKKELLRGSGPKLKYLYHLWSPHVWFHTRIAGPQSTRGRLPVRCVHMIQTGSLCCGSLQLYFLLWCPLWMNFARWVCGRTGCYGLWCQTLTTRGPKLEKSDM